MRISDWSSDVCSSDLLGNLGLRVGKRRARLCGHIIGGDQILRKTAVRDLVHLPKHRPHLAYALDQATGSNIAFGYRLRAAVQRLFQLRVRHAEFFRLLSVELTVGK